VGGRLLGYYLAQGRGLGFHRFRLDLASDNIAARRLYERAGFRVTEQRHSASFALTYLSMSAVDKEAVS
jgi:RimJ/RimL family protein N-acetyltransferase